MKEHEGTERGARSPAGRWLDGKARGSELLSKAMSVVGWGATRTASTSGASTTLLRKMADPDDSHAVPLQVLWTGGKVGRQLLTEVAAEMGCAVLDATADHFGDAHVARLHSLLKECGDVNQAYALAMASGKDPRECPKLLKEIDEAIHALSQARQTLAGAARGAAC